MHNSVATIKVAHYWRPSRWAVVESLPLLSLCGTTVVRSKAFMFDLNQDFTPPAPTMASHVCADDEAGFDLLGEPKRGSMTARRQCLQPRQLAAVGGDAPGLVAGDALAERQKL
jgi:hypothetical protein